MLSENIKNLRKQKGLTQEELAVRLNVVRQTVSKWEKGISVPRCCTIGETGGYIRYQCQHPAGKNS